VLISLGTMLWLPTSLALAPALIMSIMIFAAPGSTEQLGTVTLFLALWAYPPTCWVAIALSWLLFAQRLSRVSLICMALPLLPIGMGVFGYYWIEVVQRGSLGR
jgi:hypothetical protein